MSTRKNIFPRYAIALVALALWQPLAGCGGSTNSSQSTPTEPTQPTQPAVPSNPQPAPPTGPVTSLGINVLGTQLYTTVTKSTTGSSVSYSFATPASLPAGPYPIVATAGSKTTSTVPSNPYVSNDNGFNSLSYEKTMMQNRLFSSSNTALITLFGLLHAPNTGGIIRIGGGSLETNVWTPNGAGQTSGQIAPSDVQALAGFLQATGWKVIYGIPLKAYGATGAGAATAESDAAAEALYVAQTLGPSLYAFEIGNEPDGYGSPIWTYSEFLTAYTNIASAIEANLKTNSLAAEPLAGGAFDGNDGWFASFAQVHVPDVYETGLLTQHYYRGPSSNPTPTVANLISYPDTSLQSETALLEFNSYTSSTPWTMGETNSYYNSGTPGVSNSYASTLWVLDHLFTLAQFGGVGANFHCGNSVSYSPIYNSGSTVLGPQPIFSGMYLASQTGSGYMQGLSLTGNTSALNISAYAVQPTGTTLDVVVDNKSPNTLSIVLTPVQTIASGALTILTNSSIPTTTTTLTSAQLTTALSDTTPGDVTIQGAVIGTTGSFTVNAPYTLTPSGNAVTFTVPPASAALVKLQ